MESKIKEFSNEIAKEIAQRSIMDVNDVSLMISVRIKNAMPDFIEEYSSKAEKEYLKLLNEQSKNKVGTKEYNQLAYKLTIAKSKKATANRALNNFRRKDNYGNLKEWVVEKYGKHALDEFVKEQLSKENIILKQI